MATWQEEEIIDSAIKTSDHHLQKCFQNLSSSTGDTSSTYFMYSRTSTPDSTNAGLGDWLTNWIRCAHTGIHQKSLTVYGVLKRGLGKTDLDCCLHCNPPWKVLYIHTHTGCLLPSCQSLWECGPWNPRRSSPGKECGRTAPDDRWWDRKMGHIWVPVCCHVKSSYWHLSFTSFIFLYILLDRESGE